jgi:hypothetical protein
MKRIVLISSLIMIWAVGFAAPIHAQSPTWNGYNWQYQYAFSPSANTNTWANDWLGQYPAYSTNRPGLPNVATSNGWSGNAQSPTLYTPHYVGGVRVKLVPYPSPNIYAYPRYMYVPVQQR